MTHAFHIGFLIYPHVTQLDVTGPAQFFARMSGAELHFVWKNMSPVASDAGFSLLPTDTIQTCPQFDLVCVPGGARKRALMMDADVIAWLARQCLAAKYVTSVCSGAFLLGAAGLLNGCAATTHWAVSAILPRFGATNCPGRVVMDRNRITGGGCDGGDRFCLVCHRAN